MGLRLSADPEEGLVKPRTLLLLLLPGTLALTETETYVGKCRVGKETAFVARSERPAQPAEPRQEGWAGLSPSFPGSHFVCNSCSVVSLMSRMNPYTLAVLTIPKDWCYLFRLI